MIFIEREHNTMIVIEREAFQLEYLLVSDYSKANHAPLQQQLLQPSTSYDDEYYSLASTSYSSSTTYDSSKDDERKTRRVAFSNEDEVHLVQRLYPRESLNEHFYSYKDEQRFREEYRLERRLLAELHIDHSSYEGEMQDLSHAINLSKHKISHVTILHNGKIETFCHPKQQSGVDNFFDSNNFWAGSMSWYL